MKMVPLFLVGFGQVGRALVRQLLTGRDYHTSRLGIRFDVLALCDSSGAVVEQRGLDDDLLSAAISAKSAGTPLRETEWGYDQADLTAVFDVAAREGTVVIDCTAADETVPMLLAAVEKGHGVVMANKKPLSGSLEIFQSLAATGRLRYEATVGAGLPVISTLRSLLDAGDAIEAIEGAFSGTLGYLCTEIERGVPFATAVRTAHHSGYTEPDPRDDLGGTDVARKALILARTVGWPLELADIPVESLYPAEMETLTVSQFLEAVDSLDTPFKTRSTKAREQGASLRYRAGVQGGRCSVGMEMVPSDSSLGRLQGTDNIVIFRSALYHDSPLVLQGPGAGVEVTAAGVLSDALALAEII